jgi:hypothetical protein
MMDRGVTSYERAYQARRVLLEVLMTEGIFPGPMPPALFRSVGVMAEKPDLRYHFIQVVLPVAVDISNIPSEVDGVRVVIVHEDRHWVTKALTG